MVGEGEEDFGQAKKTNLIGTVCILGGRFVKVCGDLVKWLQARSRRPKTWLCSVFPCMPLGESLALSGT